MRRRFFGGSNYITFTHTVTAENLIAGFYVVGAKQIDWGDGQTTIVATYAASVNHVYDTTGIYKVTVYGNIVEFNSAYTAVHRAILNTIDVSHAPNLMILRCQDSSLTELDITKNTALQILYCFNNPIVSLDTSRNIALTALYCSYCNLSAVNVTNNTELTTLYLHGNSLTSLDVTHNTKLQVLYCYGCLIGGILDVSRCAGLRTFRCDINRIESLIMGNHPFLTSINCYSNLIAGTLDLRGCPALQTLTCHINQIAELLLNCPVLTIISGHTNQWATIDLSSCVNLLTLAISYNANLTSLDLSNNTKITNIAVNNTSLLSINLSENVDLIYLNAANTPIALLDISNNSKLAWVKTGGKTNTLKVASIAQFNNFTNTILSYTMQGINATQYLSMYDVANVVDVNDNPISFTDLLNNLASCIQSNNLFDYPQWQWFHPLTANETKDLYRMGNIFENLLYRSKIGAQFSLSEGRNVAAIVQNFTHTRSVYHNSELTGDMELSVQIICMPDAEFVIIPYVANYNGYEYGDRFRFKGNEAQEADKFEVLGNAQYSYEINGDGNYVITLTGIRINRYLLSTIATYLYENKYPAESNPYTSKVLAFTQASNE
ncbi:hypothetical protein D0T49_00425 [Paludibacter sp. 221]|uniref:leucine-rich repeat domain-containing protein n=1 Tax=Paludibacter sp. 221 TaxID=2302939 RepID=UPI0013D7F875|nr:hypothetical protein [Paludibacter sp. 221]NDV45518.1 hypothetical protein [Paludibacter sp. 221]